MSQQEEDVGGWGLGHSFSDVSLGHQVLRLGIESSEKEIEIREPLMVARDN